MRSNQVIKSFLDANIIVYHFLGLSQQCKQLLDRCYKKDLHGITTAFVIAEVTHRLMMAEAVKRNLITSSQPVKKLRERPDLVKSLVIPNQCVDGILAMNIEVVISDISLLKMGEAVRSSVGLLTNDSLLVAAMQKLNLQNLATNDRDFLRVQGISVYQPDDISITG